MTAFFASDIEMPIGHHNSKDKKHTDNKYMICIKLNYNV